MSGPMVGEILEFAPADASPLEMLILVALAESARPGDRIARYDSSAEAIARRVRSTPGSVRNALARLRKRGLVEAVNDRAGRGRAQQYRLPIMHEGTRNTRWT